MPTVETLEVTCRRGEDGRFGIPIEDRGGDAWVGEVQAAEVSSSLRAGDRITHVNGGGPFDFRRARAALMAAGAEARVTIVRGEKPPTAPRLQQRFSVGTALGGCSAAIILLAISWPVLFDLPPASEALARAAGVDSGSGADGGVLGGRMAMTVNGRTFSIRDDGSADEPELLCAALRSDTAMMAQIRRNEPEWAALIVAEIFVS